MGTGSWRAAAVTLSYLLSAVNGYTVPFKDDDYSRQTCSGMWAGPNTTIEVSFDSGSQGQAALIMYEWKDAPYLGKVTNAADETIPKTYVCTAEAVLYKYCDATQAGRFIVDLPAGTTMNDTSFYSARIVLGNSTVETTVTPQGGVINIPASTSSFWDNPAGNPVIPEDESKKYTSPWRRALALARRRTPFNPIDSVTKIRAESNAEGLLQYKDAISYPVNRTGYYCVAIVPVTVRSNTAVNSTDVPNHPTYTGQVTFHNKFSGQLPATDYPKVNFYMVMFMVYTVLGGVWAWLCYKNRDDLLPIQYYLSGLVGFLVVEMIANWVYYRYLNAHGKGTGATAFLFVVAILDAGRNALSFFMLLVVSMGLSVVRESLGSTMIRCQVLTGAHFIFGVLYAVGVVELELESTSALVLLLFVIPLAFTLSGFLLWILYSLNGTITELQVRKQSYKLGMFTRLYRILWLTVAAIAVFFVASSLSFSERLAEDYAANSWKYRWWLLDGWLALLYLLTFWSIAYIWRPSSNNRYLAMSDELAQDDPEDYDMANLEGRAGRSRGPAHPDDDDDDDADAATLVGGRPGHTGRTPRDDAVVFEIGDEDGDEEDEEERKRRLRRLSGEGHEREGLMSGGGRKDE